MRIELQDAYILHTRAYRDTSLLIDCISRDYGRLTLVAKGARNPKQRLRQLLQPFYPLLLSWQGKSQLKTLVGVEPAGESLLLSNRYLYSGFYINELLTYLLPEGDPADEIFVLYDALLKDLQAQHDLELSLRQFEFTLLELLGYGIDFSCDADAHKPIAENIVYAFVANRGFIASDSLATEQAYYFQGEHILALATGDYAAEGVRRAAKYLSRLAFAAILQGKEIKSRELFF